MAAFKNGNPGCCCSPPWIEVRVHGCGYFWLAGAAVELRLAGALVATGTSDAFGKVLFDGLAAGTYSITASKSRFAPVISGATIPSDGGVVAHVALYPAEGYVCCAACVDPPPAVLYFRSAGAGTVTLAWDTESGISRWIGSKTFTMPALRLAALPYVGCEQEFATCGVTVGFEVRCPVVTGLGPAWPVYAYADTKAVLSEGEPFHLTPYYLCDDSSLLCLVSCLAGAAGGTSLERIEADCSVPVAFSGDLPTTAGGGTFHANPITGACITYDGLPIDTLSVFFGGAFTVSET